MSRPSIEKAKTKYVHRFTMEHVPAWALIAPQKNGRYYAPQFTSDTEWYAHTTFPGEPGIRGNSRHCESSGHTWPLGKTLDKPYRKIP